MSGKATTEKRSRKSRVYRGLGAGQEEREGVGWGESSDRKKFPGAG